MWNDVRNKMPEVEKEVLCITRKFGHAQNRIETDIYELLWWDGKVWENMNIDDFETNPDYYLVVYWMVIPELSVGK